jgi:hypothetical protein
MFLASWLPLPDRSLGVNVTEREPVELALAVFIG